MASPSTWFKVNDSAPISCLTVLVAFPSRRLTPYLTMAEGLKLVTLTFDKDVNKLSYCAG